MMGGGCLGGREGVVVLSCRGMRVGRGFCVWCVFYRY